MADTPESTGWDQTSILAGLQAEFAEDESPEPATDDDEPVAEDNADEAPADEGDEQDLEATDEEADEDEEPAEDEEDADDPKGRRYLTMLGADGKPHRVHIDKLLEDTQHDVVVDGEKQYVSYKELRDGYIRQKTFTQRTQELAKQRQELMPFAAMVSHAKADPDFVEYVQRYFEQGPHPELNTAARADMADGQIAALLDSDDPADVSRAKEILKAREHLRTVLAKREQYQKQVQAEQEQMLKQYVQQERSKLLEGDPSIAYGEAIPDLGELDQPLAEAMARYGFSDKELRGVIRSNFVRVAIDAMRYRKMLEEGNRIGLQGKRKAPAPPKVAKPSAGQAASARQVRNERDLIRRAKQSGNVQDWAAVIRARMGT